MRHKLVVAFAILINIMVFVSHNVRAKQGVSSLPESKSSLFISNIRVNFGFEFNRNELDHLIGISAPGWVDYRKIGLARANLLRKGRFKDVNVHVERCGADVWELIFDLDTHWRFDGVDLVGVPGGSQRYEDLYCLEPGDVFHLSQHEGSIVALRCALKDEGFFQADVSEEFIRDDCNKTVKVRILVEPGEPFITKDAVVRFCGHVRGDLSLIRKMVISECMCWLTGKQYRHVLTDLCTRKITEVLSQFGLLDVNVILEPRANYDTCTVDIICDISVGRSGVAILRGAEKLLRNAGLVDPVRCGVFSSSLIKNVVECDSGGNSFLKKTILRGHGGEWKLYGTSQVRVASIKVRDDNGKEVVDLQDELNNSLEGKPFSKELLKLAVAGISQRFISEGFWDFRFSNDTVTAVRAGWCSVELVVFMGIQRILKSVDLIAAQDIPLDVCGAIEHLVNVQKDVPCDPFFVDVLRRKIERLCRSEGYWSARVYTLVAERSAGVDRRDVFIGYKVAPGDKAHFGKVILRGGETVPFEKIKSMLQFSEGEEWDKGKLENSRKRVEHLGVFRDVQFFPGSLSLDSAGVPVCLSLKNDSPYEASVKAGIAVSAEYEQLFSAAGLNAVTFELGSAFVAKNPFGCADRAALSVDLSRERQIANMTYQCPRPVGMPFILLVGADVGRTLQAGLRSTKTAPRYRVHYASTTIGGKRYLDSGGKIGINVGCQWLGIEASLGVVVPKKFYLTCNALISAEDINNGWALRSGHSAACVVSCAVSPLNGGSMGCMSAEGSIFTRIFDRASAIIRAKGMVTGVFGDDPWCSEYNREIMKNREPVELFPPLSDHVCTSEHVQHVVLPGFSKRVYDLSLYGELRIPLWRHLGAALFQRFLVRKVKKWDFRSSLLSFSGIGLRCITPLGIICADAGLEIPIGGRHDRRWLWRVALGQAF